MKILIGSILTELIENFHNKTWWSRVSRKEHHFVSIYSHNQFWTLPYSGAESDYGKKWINLNCSRDG